MKKYLIFNNAVEEKQLTDFDYQVGEIISVGTSRGYVDMKCLKIEVINGELLQYFNEPKRIVYEW